MGDDLLEETTETQVDGQDSTIGDGSYPDPVVEAEGSDPSPSDAELPDAEGSGVELPAAPSPPSSAPPHIPQEPIYDGGFTPSRATREATLAPDTSTQVKFFSVAQLRNGVNDGVINEEQMAEQLQLQSREQARIDNAQALLTHTKTQKIDQQLNQYHTMFPGWDQSGTESNQKAQRAYSRLLEMGLTENPTTKLLALEQAFGPIDRVKQARQNRTQSAALRETTQGIGRRGSPPSHGKKKDPLDAISMDEKRLYKEYIGKGFYRNWDAVRDEIRSAATQTSNRQLREAHAGIS